MKIALAGSKAACDVSITQPLKCCNKLMMPGALVSFGNIELKIIALSKLTVSPLICKVTSSLRTRV